jgi:hypothetical protein
VIVSGINDDSGAMLMASAFTVPILTPKSGRIVQAS